MSKITKTFDTLKEARIFQRDQTKAGRQTNLHPYKVKQSYRGKNKTFYDVKVW